MRNKTGVETLRRLLTHARYEVLPTPACEEEVREHVPPDIPITVTASPSKGLSATLELTERLAGAGYRVVPHLAARMVSGRSELADIAARLRELGVDTVFVPAGDADPPAGDYHASLDLLRDLPAVGTPFAHVGITGYPESHPSIVDDVVVQAMWDKRAHADHVVSNLTFDPALVQRWLRRVRQRGITMPLLVGVPGPVDRAKLLLMATKIGVGESTKFLAKHRRTLTRLAAPGGFTGQQFLERSATAFGAVDANVAGLHVFTFNQVAATEAWRREWLERLAAGAASRRGPRTRVLS
ncbi:methylenetetrahydrofolate reductase (NADPH) [Jatrophihabitans endophyticus]|uniref:Methylenetetrahydrofolate reductase n=1 Tax=Jatrophihabitans endophyticus TaxID=1206085 RepID=A0A1M5N8D7_9ACTN|nr:methylenetetrahydrofolate reductase [Jatrophihabitans endophyticus]SHG85761.1 methylenetetrahydrofolate reductase (NADPH) [Jatrophihabitans endophyticus]